MKFRNTVTSVVVDVDESHPAVSGPDWVPFTAGEGSPAPAGGLAGSDPHEGTDGTSGAPKKPRRTARRTTTD